MIIYLYDHRKTGQWKMSLLTVFENSVMELNDPQMVRETFSNDDSTHQSIFFIHTDVEDRRDLESITRNYNADTLKSIVFITDNGAFNAINSGPIYFYCNWTREQFIDFRIGEAIKNLLSKNNTSKDWQAYLSRCCLRRAAILRNPSRYPEMQVEEAYVHYHRHITEFINAVRDDIQIPAEWVYLTEETRAGACRELLNCAKTLKMI